MLRWDGARVSKEIREAATAALQEAGEIILGESNRHVPLDIGDLEASGEVSTDAREVQANISYDRPYAVAQHENLSYKHKAGRTAKYLENAVKKMAGTVITRLAETLKKTTGG